MSIQRILFITVIFLLPVMVSAETIYLKNGRSIPGQIIGQDREAIRIRTLNGGIRRVRKTDIRRVTYEPVAVTRRREEARQKRAQEEARRKEEAERKKAEEEAAKKEEEERKKAEEQALLEEEERRKGEDAEETARREAEEREAREREERERQEREERARERQEREEAYTAGGPYRGDAFLRSLILPGWGQYYQGRTGAAFAIGGAFFASAGGVAYYDRIYASRRSDYETSANTFFLTSPLFLSSAGFSISSPLQLAPLGFGIAQNTTAARSRMENAANWSNNFRSALLGFYIWNLADVLIFHPSQNQEVGVSVSPGGAGVRFSFRY